MTQSIGVYVRNAIANGGIANPDERGLMPLDEARQWLAGLDRYVKGEPLDTDDGKHVLASDRTWAALMSLADGAEFVAATRRLSWEFEVRGMENLAPLQRYGEAVLEWISDRIDADGVLHNTPWCLLPCLLACPAAPAFDVAARVRFVAGSATGNHDVSVLARWVLRHPDPGYRMLAQRPECHATIAELHGFDSRGTRHALETALGAQAAGALLADLALVDTPLPDEVRAALAAAPHVELGVASNPVSLAEMDNLFENFEVPLYDNANYFSAAMRLTGFVVPGGQDGLVFQSLQTGLGLYGFNLMIATFGFGAKPGIRWNVAPILLHEHRLEELRSAPVWRLPLPNGEAEVTVGKHPEFGDELGPMETVMLAITADRTGRDQTFFNVRQLVDQLGLPEQAVQLFTLDSWEHPEAGEPASSSVDLVLAVEALRERRAITASITGKDRDAHLRERIPFLGGWGSRWPEE